MKKAVKKETENPFIPFPAVEREKFLQRIVKSAPIRTRQIFLFHTEKDSGKRSVKSRTFAAQSGKDRPL